MKFRVILEHDPETGDYSAVGPELPGCASAGETEAEASANIRKAIELTVRRRFGQPLEVAASDRLRG
jgi:predicted RNase H-like HicB family nuclease